MPKGPTNIVLSERSTHICILIFSLSVPTQRAPSKAFLCTPYPDSSTLAMFLGSFPYLSPPWLKQCWGNLDWSLSAYSSIPNSSWPLLTPLSSEDHTPDFTTPDSIFFLTSIKPLVPWWSVSALSQLLLHCLLHAKRLKVCVTKKTSLSPVLPSTLLFNLFS